MKRSWIKLYIEILDDPKMGRLPDHLWRRCMEFFLIAGEYDCDGLLPPLNELSWRLRVSQEDVLNALGGLEELGLVQCKDAQWKTVSLYRLLFAKYLTRRKQWLLVRKLLAPLVFLRDGRVCANCRSTEDLTIDHVTAIVNGGTDELSNLSVLCRTCNSSKGAR